MVGRVEDAVYARKLGRAVHKGMARHRANQDLMKQELELLDYVIAVAHKPR